MIKRELIPVDGPSEGVIAYDGLNERDVVWSENYNSFWFCYDCNSDSREVIIVEGAYLANFREWRLYDDGFGR